MGLDDSPSWIVTNDVNSFKWPGPDLRPAKGNEWIFGRLPPNAIKTVALSVEENRQKSRLKEVDREAPPKKDWSKKKTSHSGVIKKASTPRRDPDRSR